jgi:uncharacterized protein YbaP (TraB family)
MKERLPDWRAFIRILGSVCCAHRRSFCLCLVVISSSVALVGCDAFQPSRGLFWEMSRADTRLILVPTMHLLSTPTRRFSGDFERRVKDSVFVIVEVNFNDLREYDELKKCLERVNTSASAVVSESLRTKVRSEMPHLSALVAKPDLDLATLLNAIAPTPSGNSRSRIDNSLDLRLGSLATKHGKVLRGLETYCEQVETVGTFTVGEQHVLDTIASKRDGALRQLEDAFVRAWNTGEWGDFERLYLDQEQRYASFARLTERAITGRNDLMARRVSKLCTENGQFIVAIGAAHFIGQGNIIEALHRLGFHLTAHPPGFKQTDLPR